MPTLPKLRTFNTFKDFNSEAAHIYKPLSFMQRKSISKFRVGLLSLKIETDRYVRPRIPPEERFCQMCNNGGVEDETHFLLFCSKFDNFRQILLNKVPDLDTFHNLNNSEKLKLLLNEPSLVKDTAKFIVSAFEHRSTLL